MQAGTQHHQRGSWTESHILTAQVDTASSGSFRALTSWCQAAKGSSKSRSVGRSGMTGMLPLRNLIIASCKVHHYCRCTCYWKKCHLHSSCLNCKGFKRSPWAQEVRVLFWDLKQRWHGYASSWLHPIYEEFEARYPVSCLSLWRKIVDRQHVCCLIRRLLEERNAQQLTKVSI